MKDTLYYCGVIAYFFPGASKTKPDGSDRFRTDMMKVREIWTRPLHFLEMNPIHLTEKEANVINLQQADVDCDSPFLAYPSGDNNKARADMARKRDRDFTNLHLSGNLISVWYVPFATFSNGHTVGCAYSNIGNPVYHYIIMAEDSNNSSNQSALAHEIGHILFGTVPNQNDSDPTGPATDVLITKSDGTTLTITPAHSLKENNVMYPIAGNNTGIEPSQHEKAAKSRILIGMTEPSVHDK